MLEFLNEFKPVRPPISVICKFYAKKKKINWCEFRINFLFHKETYPYYTKFHCIVIFLYLILRLISINKFRVGNFQFYFFFSFFLFVGQKSKSLSFHSIEKEKNSWKGEQGFSSGDLINSIASNFHECQEHLAAVDSIHSLDQRVRTLMATLPQNCSRRLADYYGCVLLRLSWNHYESVNHLSLHRDPFRRYLSGYHFMGFARFQLLLKFGTVRKLIPPKGKEKEF